MWYSYIFYTRLEANHERQCLRLRRGRSDALAGRALAGGAGAVPNISQRMLTLDLRALEEAGLLTRTIYAEVPVKVEYRLTDEGLRLRELVEMLRAIGLCLRGQADAGGAFLAPDAADNSL